MIKQIPIVVAVICVMLIAIDSAQAAIPHLISFQGKLNDSDGTPLNGEFEITFRIYNVAEGSTPLWSEMSDVSCEDGMYSVILGLTTRINLDFDGEYWLGVQVTGDEELSPRYRIVSVPVAFRAAVAESAVTAASANLASWNNLTDVPPGFADGTDDVGEGGGPHDHWGGSWEGSGTGLELFAESDGIALDAHSEDNYAIEASSGGTTSLYGHTGLSGLQKRSASILGEGSSSFGVAGLSRGAAGVAGWSKEESGVYGYSGTHRGVSGVSEDRTGVYGSSSEGSGVYGYSQGGSGVFGKIGTSGLTIDPAGGVGEGRHARGVAGFSYDGFGIYGNSQGSSGGMFRTESNGPYALKAESAGGSSTNPGLHVTGRSYFNGHVGMGTASPETNFHLYKGAGGGSNPISSVDPLVVESDNNAYLNVITPNNKWGGILFSDEGRDQGAIRYNHSEDKMDFRTAHSTRMAINSSGNVGIGTTNPTAKLDVNGDLKVTGEIEASNAIDASDIIDEPRAVSGFHDFYWLPNSGGPHTLLTKTIYCPTDGYLLIFATASAQIHFPVESGTCSMSLFVYSAGYITKGTGYLGFSAFSGSYTPTGSLASSDFIAVTEGSHTFELRVQRYGLDAINDWFVEDARMTILFVPTQG